MSDVAVRRQLDHLLGRIRALEARPPTVVINNVGGGGSFDPDTPIDYITFNVDGQPVKLRVVEFQNSYTVQPDPAAP